MNRLKSILLGGLLASVSIAVSTHANASEVNFRNEHLNTNTIAFNNAKLIRERQLHEQQVREQKARELRERQAREQKARELRERQAREQKARELRERQAREQKARELRERQARLHH
ncbi:hypothetical protein [Nostoc sp. DedQUE03]|uniref:hypothetical protein n=1 Tax=Nostoc sp. DedQUE03 TaxID=3075389 RepID=UPI0039192E99